MSSINLEGLEIKEATPSIAPSIYESFQYTKKWRILLALGIGISLIGLCVLVFYLTAESRRPKGDVGLTQKGKLAILTSNATMKEWRTKVDSEECYFSTQQECPESFGEVPVFLLLLGGLRIDQAPEIPALLEFEKCGASMKTLVPSYPTFNYPNMYSIATGLFPESHGIVSFKMYDSKLNKNFSSNDDSSLDPQWWKGEPIWNTLEKNGRKTASFHWPGSNIRIQGTQPTFYQNDEVDFVIRMKKIRDWILLPREERPQLIMMYYDEPVSTAQKFGPFSPQTKEQLAIINRGLDELMSSLQSENIFNCVDIIVASDHGITSHGVAASSCESSIYIDQMLDEPIPGRLFTGPVGRIDFNDETDETNRNRIIKELQCKDAALRVLTKNQVPKRYHYTSGSRIGDVLLDTKPGYRIATDSDGKCLAGEFGYDDLSRPMQGVFVAQGPHFKVGFKTDSFRNIEIYNLLSYMLDVEPAPNNGTRGSLLHLLKSRFISGEDFKEPQRSYLQESVKPVLKRDTSAIIENSDDADKESESCSCEQTVVDPTLKEKSTTVISTTTKQTTTTTPEPTTTSTTTTTQKPTTTTTKTPEITTPSESTTTSTITTTTTESSKGITEKIINVISKEELLMNKSAEPISSTGAESSTNAVTKSLTTSTSFTESTTTTTTIPITTSPSTTTNESAALLNETTKPFVLLERIMATTPAELISGQDTKQQIEKAASPIISSVTISSTTVESIKNSTEESIAVKTEDQVVISAHVIEELNTSSVPTTTKQTMTSTTSSESTTTSTSKENKIAEIEAVAKTTTKSADSSTSSAPIIGKELYIRESKKHSPLEVSKTDLEPGVSEPVTEPGVSEPVTEPEVLEPVTESEVPEPVTEKETSEPVTEQAISEPVTEPEISEPVTEPEISELVSELEVSEAVPEPKVSEAVSEPEASEPVLEPENPKADSEPEVSESVSEPEASEAVSESEVSEPVFERVQELVAESTIHESLAEPEERVLELAAEPQISEPVAEPLISGPVAEPQVSGLFLDPVPLTSNSSSKSTSTTTTSTDTILSDPSTTTTSFDSSNSTTTTTTKPTPSTTTTASTEPPTPVSSDIFTTSSSSTTTKITTTFATTNIFDPSNTTTATTTTPSTITTSDLPTTNTSSSTASTTTTTTPTSDLPTTNTTTSSSTASTTTTTTPITTTSTDTSTTTTSTIPSSTTVTSTDGSNVNIKAAKLSFKDIEIRPLPEGLKVMSLVKNSKNEANGGSEVQNEHCPWGFPSLSAPEVSSDTLHVLLHSHHVIGFPESLDLGVWTSFTLTKKRFTELDKLRSKSAEGGYINPEERKKKSLTVGCWISDSRLQRSSRDQCSNILQTDMYEAKNVSLRQLFPDEFELRETLNTEGFLLSNLAPLMKGFEQGPRRIMLEAIEKWTRQKGSLNVVHGPVFDYDYNGKRDSFTHLRNTVKPLIPSNYFYVVTLCNETQISEDSESDPVENSVLSCSLANMKVYSFIFPNTENDDTCRRSNRDYLRYHAASLADVENLTSLRFFKNIDYRHYLRLRARQHLRIPPF